MWVTSVKFQLQGWPRGQVVKVPCTLLWWPGVVRFRSRVRTSATHQPCSGGIPDYKVEEDLHRCQLRAVLPQAKKKGGLATNVSSGQIFPTKTKKKFQLEVVIYWSFGTFALGDFSFLVLSGLLGTSLCWFRCSFKPYLSPNCGSLWKKCKGSNFVLVSLCLVAENPAIQLFLGTDCKHWH